MSAIPKHEAGTTKTRKRKPSYPTVAEMPAPQPAESPDLGGIEVALASLASVVGSYAHNATLGENCLALYSEVGGYPVRVELVESPASEALHSIAATLDHLEHLELLAKSSERIATAFERIATVLEARA